MKITSFAGRLQDIPSRIAMDSSYFRLKSTLGLKKAGLQMLLKIVRYGLYQLADIEEVDIPDDKFENVSFSIKEGDAVFTINVARVENSESKLFVA